jgi:hypothetical protein
VGPSFESGSQRVPIVKGSSVGACFGSGGNGSGFSCEDGRVVWGLWFDGYM